jgi:hypothetical protein
MFVVIFGSGCWKKRGGHRRWIQKSFVGEEWLTGRGCVIGQQH